jgi:hypothetical protein
VKTLDIFICRECGLPIRNKPEGDKCVNRECFTCAQCVVCEKVTHGDTDSLRKRLYGLISTVVQKLYRYHHSGQNPPESFKQAIKAKLDRRSNLAEAKIDEIKQAIGKIKEPVENAESKHYLLRQVAASERVLTGFFYLSRSRIALAKSPTLSRHWVALGRKLHSVAEQGGNPGFVLSKLKGTRYDLNLVRLSKLIGDNPVCINRDREHYTRRRKENHIREHMEELRKQIAIKGSNPEINGTTESLLRFAGNACFITEYDEVIEFREDEHNHLVKYLIKDEILIVINDLWFLESYAVDQREKMPLAELVTVYPKEKGAKRVMKALDEGRYLPNCVDLKELSQFSRDVESQLGLIRTPWAGKKPFG